MSASRPVAVTPEQFATFGELLKFLRHRAGLTQLELSIAAGYSESQISRLEQNQRAADAATAAARFVPALHLESEPVWAARLRELAAASRPDSEPRRQESAVLTPLHNLPTQLTSFVGREKELVALRRLLMPDPPAEAVRLLTLTGPGGTGKTRLALRVASDLLSVFPDGAWWVDLAPLTDPSLIPQAAASALAVRPEGSRPILDTLCEHLRPKKVLLILDNCEHLVQASAHFAEALLHVCPSLHILASSREILGVAGEHSFYVPSLSTPDPRATTQGEALLHYEAVRLFVERAAAAAPNFVLTNQNAAAVAQLCYRLDGIPLAVELAAARLRMLSVEQMAARLDDRFRLLTGGSRTALPRQQTLQASIDWSYELLTEPEQVLLRRLSVFAGGWTLEAAETVGAGEAVTPGDVVELLAHLIDKSLVSVEAPAEFTRYRLLETIRQYALAKLAASGEADLVRRRHAAYYLAVAEPGGSNRWGDFDLQPVWLDQVETEHDNMRAALTWTQSATGSAELGLRLAGALAQFWFWREYWYEGRDWLEAALAHADAEGVNHPPARAGLLRVLGGMRALLADYAAGEALLATSLQLFQELGDTYMSAWSLERLGWLARERGDAATARRRLEESLTLFRQLGHEHGIAWASVTLGEVAVMLEDGPWATALIEEALTLFHRHGITLGMGWALNHLGHVAQIQGKYEQAIRLHEESLPLFRKIGPKNLGVGWAFQGLGESALAQDDAALAVRHFMEALGLFRDMGDRTGMAWCLAGLAGAAASSEEPERAAWLWGAAEALRQSIGARPAPAARATRERLQAQVHAQLGDDTFNEAWAGGGAATPEQAIARALQSNE